MGMSSIMSKMAKVGKCIHSSNPRAKLPKGCNLCASSTSRKSLGKLSDHSSRVESLGAPHASLWIRAGIQQRIGAKGKRCTEVFWGLFLNDRWHACNDYLKILLDLIVGPFCLGLSSCPIRNTAHICNRTGANSPLLIRPALGRCTQESFPFFGNKICWYSNHQIWLA